MRLKIQHTTRYTYPGRITDNHNEVRLMPLSDDRQTCTDFWLATTPLAHVFFYNLPTGRVHHFNVKAPHTALTVTATSIVLTQRVDPFADLQLIGDDSSYYDSDIVREDYAEYLMPTKRVPFNLEVDDLIQVAKDGAQTEGTAGFLISLNRVIHRVFEYAQGATDVDTPVQEVIASRIGVCQDFAHIMLAICRKMGIPARYVSGYLFTGGSERQGADTLGEKAERQLMSLTARRQAAEAKAKEDAESTQHLIDGGAMHAWIECLLPNGQWCGFDPTNCLLTNDLFVRVHTGRDYGDVPPLRGVYAGPNATKLEVSVTVSKDE